MAKSFINSTIDKINKSWNSFSPTAETNIKSLLAFASLLEAT